MNQIYPQQEETMPFGTTYVEFHLANPETARSIREEMTSCNQALWGNEVIIMLDIRTSIISISRLLFEDPEDPDNYFFRPFDNDSMDLASTTLHEFMQRIKRSHPKTEIRFFKSGNVSPFYKSSSREEAQKSIDAGLAALEFLMRNR